MSEEDDVIILFEAPKIVKPEFRLYYDDAGKVLFYTCEKPPGNYIVIDALTFAESRPDVRVVNGRISTVSSNFIVSKLMPDENEGISCSDEDVSIILSKNVRTKKIKWKLKTYEL